MRIISRFRDYYDNALAHGQDDTLLLLRNGQTYPNAFLSRNELNPDVPKSVAWLKELAKLAPRSSTFIHRRRRWQLQSGWALIGGRLYPFAQLFWPDAADNFSTSPAASSLEAAQPSASKDLSDTPDADEVARFKGVYFYEEAPLSEALAALGQKRDLKKSGEWSWMRSNRLSWSGYLSLKGSERWMEPALQSQLALAHWHSHTDELALGAARMANVELYRVLHPVQAYQLLSQFVGNLAAPEKPTTSITDADRLTQRGFDQQSFRRPPGQPKRRKALSQ